jgi:GNAT superfamily N-acetyltransferase
MISTTVTHLHLARPANIAAPISLPLKLHDRDGRAFTLEHWPQPNILQYRALYKAVGGEYLWWERLAMDDATLQPLIDPAYATILRLMHDDRAVGYGEWVAERQPNTAYIAYFGLASGFEGCGLAKPMMQSLLTYIWHHHTQPEHITLNTCTMDHPRALGFYKHIGFVAERREQISFADPSEFMQTP